MLSAFLIGFCQLEAVAGRKAFRQYVAGTVDHLDRLPDTILEQRTLNVAGIMLWGERAKLN